MSFLTRKHLPRRTFLRGAGAAIALPLLESMVPAQTPLHRTVAQPKRRLGCVFVPHGAVMDRWTPTTDERGGLKLGPILKPLDAHREYLTVVSNLEHAIAAGVDATSEHGRSAAIFLSGARPRGQEMRCGISVDQVVARQLGQETVLPSLELGIEDIAVTCGRAFGCAYINSVSWRTDTTPLPTERSPQRLFAKLFGDGGNAEQRKARNRENRSILDSVLAATHGLRATLPPADRVRLEGYQEDIREIERRLVLASHIDQSELAAPAPPAGDPQVFGDHLKLFFDLLVVAYRADLTRVFSLMYAKDLSGATYPESGTRLGFHIASHHSNLPGGIDEFAKINLYHAKLFNYFIERLRATADGDGNLLDHSLILYGSAMSNGNEHNRSPLPVLLAGRAAGRVKGNRHLVQAEHTPMSNLLLGMLDVFDIHQDRFGDSNGRITL